MQSEKTIRRIKAIQGKSHQIKLLTHTRDALLLAQETHSHTKYEDRIKAINAKIARLQADNDFTQKKIDAETNEIASTLHNSTPDSAENETQLIIL